MPSMKNLGNKDYGRFPTVFADYKDAISGKIKPIPREVFLDYEGKDAYFYDPAGRYISIIGLIKSGMMDVWLPPCASLEAIKKKYPDPDRSAVCAALDTGILYEYIGDGNWIPISINAIPLASHDNDGLMSSKNYDQLMDCYGRTNIIFFDLNEDVPAPYQRKANTIYEITKEVCADLNEITWDRLELVESVESAIKDPWDWYQLFDFDLKSGETFEIVDPLHKFIVSDMLVDPTLEVPEGYSAIHFMYSPDHIIENLSDGGEYSDSWPFDKFYDYMENGEQTIVTNVGYKLIESESELGSLSDKVGKDGIDSVYYMSTEEVANGGGESSIDEPIEDNLEEPVEENTGENGN